MLNQVENLSQGCPGWLLEVLRFLRFSERQNLLCLNKSWSLLPKWAGWWRSQCEFAASEFKLYCPRTLHNTDTWELYFEDLWSVRDIWQGGRVVGKHVNPEQRIKVYARLKPVLPMPYQEVGLGKEGEEDQVTLSEEEVVLPLHQRLSLLKASSKLPMSTKEAMKILMMQGAWWSGREFDEKSHELDNKDQFNLAQDEVDLTQPQHFQFSLHTINQQDGEIVMAAPSVGLRDFRFNGVFLADVTQDTIYESVGHRLVCDALNGWNGTLFVYGQTGSGKTYTMFGPDERTATGEGGNEIGLVPRMCSELLQALKEKTSDHGIEANLSLSYIEVFGDQVFDLLRSCRPVGHSKVSAQRFVLEGEVRVEVGTLEEIQSLLQSGEACKTKAATKMNDRSTRAHSLLILTIRQTNPITGARVESMLFLADLGGSERLHKSNATGAQKREATQINLGLLSLKKVIAALNERSRYVPYQDSKLTMLLSAGLGGQSRTRVIICLNQDPAHAPETLQTLRFGEECSTVQTKRGNNVNLVVSMLRTLDTQIEELKESIKKKERWETVETRRQDALVEAGTFEEALSNVGGEVIRTTRLVGAEVEHERLQDLYNRRRQLLGISSGDAS